MSEWMDKALQRWLERTSMKVTGDSIQRLMRELEAGINQRDARIRELMAGESALLEKIASLQSAYNDLLAKYDDMKEQRDDLIGCR